MSKRHVCSLGTFGLLLPLTAVAGPGTLSGVAVALIMIMAFGGPVLLVAGLAAGFARPGQRLLIFASTVLTAIALAVLTSFEPVYLHVFVGVAWPLLVLLQRRGYLKTPKQVLSIGFSAALVCTLLIQTHKEPPPRKSQDAMKREAAEAKMLKWLLANDTTFVCVHEQDTTPPVTPVADQLYRYGAWLYEQAPKNETETERRQRLRQVERMVRIASAYNHEEALVLLQRMFMRYEAWSSDVTAEMADQIRQRMDAEIPSAYYRAVSAGLGDADDENYRRLKTSADMGGAVAQFVIANALKPVLLDPQTFGISLASSKLSDRVIALYQCAAEQGHHAATLEAGEYYSKTGQVSEALSVWQTGVKFGSAVAARSLRDAFSGNTFGSKLAVDPERADRYARIYTALSDWRGGSDFEVLIPELEQITPLPPAKLASWNGTLKFVENARKPAVQPRHPSSTTIKALATTKHLDPATGRQMGWQQNCAKALISDPACP